MSVPAALQKKLTRTFRILIFKKNFDVSLNPLIFRRIRRIRWFRQSLFYPPFPNLPK
jgi:hypothetical protein